MPPAPFTVYYRNQEGNWQPEPLTLWQRIKKHGWKARIF